MKSAEKGEVQVKVYLCDRDINIFLLMKIKYEKQKMTNCKYLNL